MLCSQIKAEKEILTKQFTQERNLFQNEISALKDAVSSLKELLEINQNNLKKQQQSSLLSLVKPDDDKEAEKSMSEELLVLKERLVKAEQEANNWRLQLHKKIEESSLNEQELIRKKFELEKLQSQIERERKENQNKDYILRDHAELIKANEQLGIEKNKMVSQINNL